MIERSVNKLMSPRSKAQIEEIRTASKKRIMDAALELFAYKGYSATSISHISKAAEVSKGLMYNYFESKEHLLKEVVKDAINIGMDIFEHPEVEFESVAEEIHSIVDSIVNHVIRNKSYWKAISSLAFQPDALDHVTDIIEQHSRWGIQKGTELFSQLDIDNPMSHSMLFGAALDGMFLHYIKMDELYPLQEQADTLIATLVTPYIHTNQIS